MIDYTSIRAFWESRSRRATERPESLVNFEEDGLRLREKVAGETRAVMPLLELGPGVRILDMGAGYGQWALRFAPSARSVTAVDYQQNFLERGRESAEKAHLHNIEFVQSPVEAYIPDNTFDRIFFSGIFVHLADDLIRRMLANVLPALHVDGLVILREPTSILQDSYMLDRIYSKALDCEYSALYRTASQFKTLFADFGLSCRKEGQIFPEGSSQNKFPETRLRYYTFGKREER
ncbi:MULTISPECIES: class I SAM-dependent methyltransferase [unclassified Desulfovibrio]|uniref:class I SAM-dependent methyltransferase n=1 Tax=unclassified Desulfovibrio TaxID=2593640 RepID=UPI0013EBC5D0|nr:MULTISPECIES: class I SAM-dependent methyltransferase [unclassified Desulfovibrio]